MKYTEEHEWLDEADGIVTVGITAHAAEQLGDIVFVELPEVGSEVEGVSVYCVPDFAWWTEDRFEVVDWKTGSPSAADREQVAARGRP